MATRHQRTITAAARAMAGPSAPFEAVRIERREPGPHDVLVEILYSGICHTDVHRARGEIGATHYPIVPGHEIAGRVSEVGAQVARVAVGDLVGIGCLIDSCRTCASCREGLESYCEEGPTLTYNSVARDGNVTLGGYSERIVADERFVVRIPEGMDLPSAAPLFCAGITTYSPLRHWGAGPGMRVAVVGFGGLGHVATQIASALGAATTVINRGEEQEDDARRMGAEDYRSVTRPGVLDELQRSFDLVVSTVPLGFDLDAHIALVARDGALVNLGVPDRPASLNVVPLLAGRRSLAGSTAGGLPETQEMIDFCAEHGLGAQVEIVAAEEIGHAYDRLAAGDVRYRFVIDASTFATDAT